MDVNSHDFVKKDEREHVLLEHVLLGVEAETVGLDAAYHVSPHPPHVRRPPGCTWRRQRDRFCMHDADIRSQPNDASSSGFGLRFVDCVRERDEQHVP